MRCGQRLYTASVPPRQGIFGGTFDPPHIGHLAAATCAQDHLGTEVLHVVVANDPWQKSVHRSVTSSHHRLAMTQLAFNGLAGIEVSGLEIERGGPTYTIDTVAALERDGVETLLVVGPEAAAGLSTWHRSSDLARSVTLALVQPPGQPPIRLDGWRSVTVPMRPILASASLVRELLAAPGQANARAASELVPTAVMGYITEHKLYSQ